MTTDTGEAIMRSNTTMLGVDLGDVALAEVDAPRGRDGGLQQAERELLVAILEDAIRSYQKYAFSGTRRGRRLFREVHAWFTEPACADVPVSYDYVCEMLDIDADAVRRRLEHWRIHSFAGVSSGAPTTPAATRAGSAWSRDGFSHRIRSRHRSVPSALRVVGSRP
jgi:hypothetical protein